MIKFLLPSLGYSHYLWNLLHLVFFTTLQVFLCFRPKLSIVIVLLPVHVLLNDTKLTANLAVQQKFPHSNLGHQSVVSMLAG